MRKFLTSLFNVDSDRASLIKRYQHSILYGSGENIQIDAHRLIHYFPRDKAAMHAYFDGVFALENMIGEQDCRKLAMKLAAMPLEPSLRAAPEFKAASIRALTDICPRYAAQHPFNTVRALMYLDLAARRYSEFPALADHALNASFDLINHMGQHDPFEAAFLANGLFPQEPYMFSDEIATKMRIMRETPMFLMPVF
ncbi:MAG: hypothetical protein DI586_02565 [Micavibrio aeruginosavorus]|uniref:Uncharacterized protein n=1 Tax=Micavibrio aeruginosavorus TaxID=349221 RepID=A0A2W5HF81_9BACT|nr:MAG: hypothetical protein DI586_02565 [Micavibrio aeruginosavorus]